MRNKIISILFCVLLLAGIAVHVAFPDRYFSENEKRTLSQLPKLTWADIRSGKFGDGIEKYLADQFPARDAWVTVKTVAERLSGKKESGGVYFAKDGYLIEIHAEYDSDQLEKNLTAVKELSDAMNACGVAVRLMLVPTASEILNDKLPVFAPSADQSAVLEKAKSIGLDVVDLYDALSAHSDEYIYYRLDHHWTSLGAYYAYCAWMEAKGEIPASLSDFTRETLCDNFRGTTYSKVNWPFVTDDTIEAFYREASHTVNYNRGNYVTDSIYERKFLLGKDQYAVFLNSNQAETVVHGGGSGRLLIIKDSFANTFAQFPIDDHEETHLIDMRFFRGSIRRYIEDNGITEVLILYNIPNFAEDTAAERIGK